MRRFLALFLAFLMVFSMAACGGGKDSSSGNGDADKQTKEDAADTQKSEEGSGDTAKGDEENKLVIYTAASDEQIDAIVPLYKEMYGVDVEVVSAGTGELLARADSEKENPYGDVFFGGGESNFRAYAHLFQDCICDENDNLIDEFKNVDGFINSYYLDCPVLIYNNDLIGDIQIKGYKDLLQPELKGKIAMPDPTSSSSAIMHIQTILTDFGGLTLENEEGWDFIAKLYENLDGKMSSGSSAAYKSVVDGENVVALTYEEAAIRLIGEGANITLVYMEEGTVFTPSTLGVLKDCKHPENAKKFINLVQSKEVQNILCNDLCLRPVRDDVEYPEYFSTISDVFSQKLDQDYINEHNPEIIEKCKDIYTTVGF